MASGRLRGGQSPLKGFEREGERKAQMTTCAALPHARTLSADNFCPEAGHVHQFGEFDLGYVSTP